MLGSWRRRADGFDRLVGGQLLRGDRLGLVLGFGHRARGVDVRAGQRNPARVGRPGREAARDARGTGPIRPDRPLPGRHACRGGDRGQRRPVRPLGDRRGPRRGEPPDDRSRERPGRRLVPRQPAARVLVRRERRPEPPPQGAAGIRRPRTPAGRDRADARGPGHRQGLAPRREHAALPDDRRRADAVGTLAGRRRTARAAREGLLHRPAPRLSRRPVARLHLAGVGTHRGLRPAVPPARREGARLRRTVARSPGGAATGRSCSSCPPTAG